MSLTQKELDGLESACRKLRQAPVQEEEKYVASSPVLALMSTVLSLNRRWYNYALPARMRFEKGVYASMFPKSLLRFRDIIDRASSDRSDWSALAQTLWQKNEWYKARILAELVDYFIAWHATHAPELDELAASQKWASTIRQEEFIGRIKGLGPRAFEQLLWYIEGKQAIKFDRHVATFTDEIIVRVVAEEEKLRGLRYVAERIGISPTELDARIWYYMQSQSDSLA